MEAQQAAWNNPAAQNFKLNGKCIRHSDPIRTFERSTTLAQRGTNSFQFRFFLDFSYYSNSVATPVF